MALIHTINVGGTQYDVKSTHYATCATAAGTAAKTATIQNGNFTLDTGVKVSVKFTYANSVASTTLNINSTGAKAIRWKNAALPSSQYWSANQVVDFLYDGSYWQVIGAITDNNTTYSAATTSAAGLMSATDKAKLDNTNISYGICDTAADVAAKVVTLSGNANWQLATGSIIMVNFTNTNTAESVTINVNNTGAYPIWYNASEYTGTGTAYTGYAGRVTTYMFNGTHWVWVSNSYDANTQSNTNSTNTSNKIYLVGATSQGSSKTTYSHDTVYAGTDGHVYSNSIQAVNLSDSQALTNKTYNGYTLGAACAKGVDTSATSGSSNLITSGAMYTALNKKVSISQDGMTGLFASGATILSSNQYGDALPSSGVAGQLFFKKI